MRVCASQGIYFNVVVTEGRPDGTGIQVRILYHLPCFPGRNVECLVATNPEQACTLMYVVYFTGCRCFSCMPATNIKGIWNRELSALPDIESVNTWSLFKHSILGQYQHGVAYTHLTSVARCRAGYWLRTPMSLRTCTHGQGSWWSWGLSVAHVLARQWYSTLHATVNVLPCRSAQFGQSAQWSWHPVVCPHPGLWTVNCSIFHPLSAQMAKALDEASIPVTMVLDSGVAYMLDR